MPQIARFQDSAHLWYLNDKSSKIHIYATWSKVRKRHSKPNLLFENSVSKCLPGNSVTNAKPRGPALMRSSAAVATGDVPGPPAKGAFSSEGENDKQKEAQCQSQPQASLLCVVEEFFWIGSSIKAFSKWRLGYMELCYNRWIAGAAINQQLQYRWNTYLKINVARPSAKIMKGQMFLYNIFLHPSVSYMKTSWLSFENVDSSGIQILNLVEKCMSSMQMGTQMVKLRGGSKGLVRFFYLDEHKSCIRWRPSRKNEKAKISIDSIREVCEGKQSEIFQRYAEGSFDPNCCFSLYYGEHMESLDLVSGTGEEARTWITGLKYLMAGIISFEIIPKVYWTVHQKQQQSWCYPSLTHLDITWLKQTFTEADKNGDGSLSISEVLQLLHKLNVNLPRQKVKQMFKQRNSPDKNCVLYIIQRNRDTLILEIRWITIIMDKQLEADTDDNQGTLGFEEFCSFYKMMSTRRDLYLLMLTYSNHKDHLNTDDLARFLETEQKMTKVTKDHCLEIINKFEPCSENQKQGVLGIDGFTNYTRSPAGDIFNPEHYNVNQDMSQPLCNYFIASSHNTYLMGDQLMSQSRVDMYAWVLQAGCRCVEVDCWDGQDGEPIVHHGYTLTSKILFKDVIETINKYAFVKNDYPVILSIENHCSVPQQKKMAQYLIEILGDKLDVSNIKAGDSGQLPSPETLKGKILVKGKKLPPNIDENAEEGDVSDEDSADEMEDDCKLMNGDTSANRKQVENMAKKKLDNLMKESKIRDREDPDSFTIAALPPAGKPADKTGTKVKGDDGTDTADEANPSSNKRTGRSFMGSFSKRKVCLQMALSKSKSRKKKTMKLSRALSDLVKYTRSVGLYDIDAQASCSWQVSSLSETKAHQVMQQKATAFIHFNQRQLSRIYPSSYRVDSSNFNPQPFWNAGCQLVALNYQSEGRVLQLNRAKFYSNGNCGYIVKPACMCEGPFHPNLEDPLPGQMKKQLVLKIISGQQLPKPKDSMLGDRGEIIDPFVEVEIIGLPVDCCKEQTRVVDDNGFNPMWEETLVFTVHMPELALVRFLVWDHDPIGQDFIGQRTIAFNSMMPGYRHVYLEGMEEASIFVHVAVNDITDSSTSAAAKMPQQPSFVQSLLSKSILDKVIVVIDRVGEFHSLCHCLNVLVIVIVFATVIVNFEPYHALKHLKARAASGIKGLFHRNPKQASLDSHAAAQHSRKHPFGAHLLRRTASAPTKGQPKFKKGFTDIAIDIKDYSSEGTSEERESEDKASAAASHQSTPPQHRNGDSLASHQAKGPWDHPDTNGAFHPEEGKGKNPRFAHQHPMSEPLKRASRLCFHEPLDMKPGVFARVGLNSSGRVGMSSNCITCVIGSNESPEAERKSRVEESQECNTKMAEGERQERSNRSSSTKRQVQPEPLTKPHPLAAQPDSQQSPPCPKSSMEAQFQYSPQALFQPVPFPRSKARQTLGAQQIRTRPDASQRNARSCSVPRRRFPYIITPGASLTPDCRTNVRWQQATPPNYGTVCDSTLAPFTNSNADEGLSLSDSSSCDSFGSLSSLESPPMLPPHSVLDSRKRAVGTLQREMNALFAQKMEELRHKSPMFFAACSTVQRPPPCLAINSGDTRNTPFICSLSTPEDNLSSHHSSPPLHSPSTAINADSLLTVPTNGVVHSPVKVSGEPNKLSTFSRSTSLPLATSPDQSVPSQCSQGVQPNRSTPSAMESTPNQGGKVETLTERKNDAAQLKSDHKVSTGTTAVPAARRALFSNLSSHTPVRRTKSEGHVLVAVASAGQAQSAVPEICTDATMNDRLWSKLEAGTHRDSMSSSSSISSSDTVIDLSLPNLARKSLISLPAASSTFDPHWVNYRHSALVSYDVLRVSKSKSNPNLQQTEGPYDELKPRPLQPPQESAVDSPNRLTQRRHTWSRLYMEGLKQSSANRPSSASTTLTATTPTATASMSKSLGDLTSEDISCNFVSKYRSISRSFIIRPTRDQLRRGSPQKSRPSNALTEQLRKLTDVEPLTASDFAPKNKPQESQEESVDETLVRRTSSRSQSRVRYIANRAKKAQERQKLQGLVQGRSASFSITGSFHSGSNASPIEERGNPEGACCVARSPCSSLDLLSQLTPLGSPSPRESQSSPDPDNSEVFFMLKL
ncbi:hypothetical protein PAMP_012729 [Pampus punctatissimus]